MSTPQLRLPGGDGIRPVTAGLCAAIAVASVVAMAVPSLLLTLATPGQRLSGMAEAVQLWRPFTAALLAPGVLSIVLAVVFTYWCGADLEQAVGAKRFLLVAVASALTAAVFAQLSPEYLLAPTAVSLAWGMIGATTVMAYQKGFNVTNQLVIVGLLLLVSLSSGGGIMLLLGGLLGGILAGCVMAYLPSPRRRPDDWSRRGQTRAGRIDAALYALCAALLVVWFLLVLL